eukprot:87200-Pelagomonas_calceolata.AAC.2
MARAHGAYRVKCHTFAVELVSSKRAFATLEVFMEIEQPPDNCLLGITDDLNTQNLFARPPKDLKPWLYFHPRTFLFLPPKDFPFPALVCRPPREVKPRQRTEKPLVEIRRSERFVCDAQRCVQTELVRLTGLGYQEVACQAELFHSAECTHLGALLCGLRSKGREGKGREGKGFTAVPAYKGSLAEGIKMPVTKSVRSGQQGSAERAAPMYVDSLPRRLARLTCILSVGREAPVYVDSLPRRLLSESGASKGRRRTSDCSDDDDGRPRRK